MADITCGDSDVIILDRGDYFVKHFGKYKSGLGIIVSKNDTDISNGQIKLFETSYNGSDFNVSRNSSLRGMRGELFTSKKGTVLFRKSKDGKHVFLKDDWGGCFNSYRGLSLPDEQQGALYYKRASSNGGGCGNDYAVVPFGWRKSVSVEEL